MSQQLVTPFKVTAEDLEGLDAKTRRGLQPLLDALNVTMQQLVFFASQSPRYTVISSVLKADANGSAYFDMMPPSGRPAAVSLDAFNRKDLEPLSTVFSWSWQMAGGLVRALFVGLEPLTDYSITMSMR